MHKSGSMALIERLLVGRRSKESVNKKFYLYERGTHEGDSVRDFIYGKIEGGAGAA
jgi:hypothetical protein